MAVVAGYRTRPLHDLIRRRHRRRNRRTEDGRRREGGWKEKGRRMEGEGTAVNSGVAGIAETYLSLSLARRDTEDGRRRDEKGHGGRGNRPCLSDSKMLSSDSNSRRDMGVAHALMGTCPRWRSCLPNQGKDRRYAGDIPAGSANLSPMADDLKLCTQTTMKGQRRPEALP
jgi:hypothetical protein